MGLESEGRRSWYSSFVNGFGGSDTIKGHRRARLILCPLDRKVKNNIKVLYVVLLEHTNLETEKVHFFTLFSYPTRPSEPTLNPLTLLSSFDLSDLSFTSISLFLGFHFSRPFLLCVMDTLPLSALSYPETFRSVRLPKFSRSGNLR